MRSPLSLLSVGEHLSFFFFFYRVVFLYTCHIVCLCVRVRVRVCVYQLYPKCLLAADHHSRLELVRACVCVCVRACVRA